MAADWRATQVRRGEHLVTDTLIQVTTHSLHLQPVLLPLPPLCACPMTHFSEREQT